MDLTLDHVPFAWHDLEEITSEFERLGLSTEYGGVHSNGATHMAVLGFGDRSYIECIAERRTADHDFWPEHIANDAGPAAWCVRVPDIAADCKRALDAGYPVRGPLYGSRKRDDGTLVEWDRAEYGTPEDRLLFPFAIQDRTPLSYRVSPTPSGADSFSGIGRVVIGVQSIEAAIGKFRDFYRFPTPVRESVPGFGTVASFPGQPVALARPDGDGWLANRLDRFPDGPCSCLLETDDLEAVRDEYPLEEPQPWPSGSVSFFESDLLGKRLGVISRN